MKRLFQSALLILVFCLTASAQGAARADHVRAPLDGQVFANCADVERVAKAVDPPSTERAYTVELFSRSRGSFAHPFLSDSPISQVINWIASNRDRTYPFAMFYSVGSQYTFRCRDAQNRFVERIGPGGDPLHFRVNGGTAEIWHFDFYNVRMAHVYMLTNVPLENIDGEELLSKVTERLGARYVFLYVRRDPWFYGSSIDSTPYIFANLLTAITAEEYRRTQTLSCMTGEKCRLGRSVE